jgi:hypothetical protein
MVAANGAHHPHVVRDAQQMFRHVGAAARPVAQILREDGFFAVRGDYSGPDRHPRHDCLALTL